METEERQTGMLDCIGKRIKSRREQVGMSQAELGEETGYSKYAISLIESGKRSVPLRKVPQFAEALKVDARELMGWTDATYNYELDEYEKELIDLVRNSPPGALRKFLDIMEIIGRSEQ